MLVLTRPSAETIAAFLERERTQPFSYAEVGATKGTPPAGYTVDRYRVRLGTGQAVFEAARLAVSNWQMVRLGWVEIHPSDATTQAGTVVAVLARAWGFWSLNACRVVYSVDEPGPVRRFGFAYGTLRAHVERGEERFMIECGEDEAVWYELMAFSRPGSWVSRLCYPLARRSQRRFGADSTAAMIRAAGTAP